MKYPIISQIRKIKLSSIISLIRNATKKSIKKGDIIIPANTVGKDVFYIRKGLIRSYYYDTEKFEEITFQLYPEHHTIMNLDAILFDEPSDFTYQALEDTKVYKISYDVLMELTAKNPEFLELSRRHIGKNAMKRAFQRVKSFVFLSPEERYQQYLKDYPNIANRVPDKYIANVLGITPISLSRIRKRIASKGK